MASTSETVNVSCAPGFCGLLAIAFIVLKLCAVIDWSWWYVLMPLWIPVTLGLLTVMFFVGAAVLAGYMESTATKGRR